MYNYIELFLRFPEFKTRAVTFSYDDGYIEDRQLVSVLNRYGMKGTFNINAGNIQGNARKIPLEEMVALYQGHEIASHSFTHPHLDSLDSGGIAYQIIRDREALEEIVAKPVTGFAYPYGLKSDGDRIAACLQNCGIRYARTTVSTHDFALPENPLFWNPTCHHADSALLTLAEAFFKPDDLEHPWRITPQLFYIWGHSYEFQNNWTLLEQICQTFGNTPRVWYATNGEIIDYIHAFRALRRSANGQYIYNPTDTDIYVVANGKQVVLKKATLTTLK